MTLLIATEGKKYGDPNTFLTKIINNLFISLFFPCPNNSGRVKVEQTLYMWKVSQRNVEFKSLYVRACPRSQNIPVGRNVVRHYTLMMVRGFFFFIKKSLPVCLTLRVPPPFTVDPHHIQVLGGGGGVEGEVRGEEGECRLCFGCLIQCPAAVHN